MWVKVRARSIPLQHRAFFEQLARFHVRHEQAERGTKIHEERAASRSARWFHPRGIFG
jgi:hypothetical protein